MTRAARQPVRLAGPDEFDRMVDVERRSGWLFTRHGLVLPDDGAELDRLVEADWILAVGSPLVGFAAVGTVDGLAHLEQISVHPGYGRAGLGSLLLERVCARAGELAGELGRASVTLTTFRDVPWNGPWYARHGFVEVAESELGPGLAGIRRAERAAGLDAVAPRVAMRRAL